MTEIIQKIVLSIFDENPVLATIFIAMIPIVELRGAIPFGSSKEIWGEKALSVLEASFYSVIGSIISAVIIILLLMPIFNFLKKTKFFGRLVESFEEKFRKQSNKINNDAENNKNKGLKRWFGVMTFVAIPFPLTGVWTGSAVAVFLQMGFFKSFSSVSVGAIIAACIMMLVSKTLGDKALIIFYVFAVMFFIVIAFYIIRSFIKKKNVNYESK
jgi:uncharacterized membrane protein